MSWIHFLQSEIQEAYEENKYYFLYALATAIVLIMLAYMCKSQIDKSVDFNKGDFFTISSNLSLYSKTLFWIISSYLLNLLGCFVWLVNSVILSIVIWKEYSELYRMAFGQKILIMLFCCIVVTVPMFLAGWLVYPVGEVALMLGILDLMIHLKVSARYESNRW